MIEARTLPEMFLESCSRWADKPAQLYKDHGKYVPRSYSKLKEQVYGIACGLKNMGVEKGSTVAICAETSPEWAMLDWAILSLGAITVPIFPTLTEETIAYILADAGAMLCFAGDTKLLKKVEVASKNLAVVPVCFRGEEGFTLDRLINEGHECGMTQEQWQQVSASHCPDDTATIIYTSGTTGEPKGAELSHRAFTFQCFSIRKNLPVDHKDRFVSFLPLSHVYERMAGHYLPISCGAEIAYAESLKTLAQDIRVAQPTIIPAVPRFLESIRSKILATMQDAPFIKRKLFQMALAQAPYRDTHNLKPKGFIGALLDKLVGAKIRERFGGRVRFIVSGGAALARDVAVFFAAFGIKIVQGYGLTETAPVITINHPDRNRTDSVGEVLEGLEVRLASDGEIIMRGPSLMKGYHRKPEDTSAAIDSDGWFHTGDIGRLERNRLWITDRKKDIIVLSNGKNIAPMMLEGKLKSSPFIEEAMVIGDGMDHIAALIVPSFDALRHFCHGKPFDTSHQKELVDVPEIAALFKQEVEKVNKQLADFEKIKGFAILNEPWSQETGEITPSLKVKRPVIKEKFAEQIAKLQK